MAVTVFRSVFSIQTDRGLTTTTHALAPQEPLDSIVTILSNHGRHNSCLWQ